MRRLRLLRLLLLALLLPFVIVLVVTLRAPKKGHTPQPREPQTGESAESVEYIDIFKGIRNLLFRAGRLESDENGGYRFENIRRLEVFREDESPLIVRADFGTLTGTEGQRLVTLEGGVEFEDEVEGLLLTLPALEVNQAAGEARSLGGVEFRGPDFTGNAVSVTYGLGDQPTFLHQPEVIGSDGSTLQSERATLLDGTKDVEFDGDVRIFDAESVFEADRVRVQRDGESPKRMVATGSVRGRSSPTVGPEGEMVAERSEIRWDASGEADYLLLEGGARLRRGDNELGARRIEADRESGGEVWSFVAWGDVRAVSLLDEGPATLLAEELTGTVDATGRLLSGEAVGAVRFESGETSAESERATFRPDEAGREIALLASSRRRARLARSRSRVAAERIFTDPKGTYLLAEHRVEASLLPAGDDADAGAGLFREDEATHFVSDRLEGNPKINRLVFTGNVRGWQDERNLRAERVQIDETGERLIATGGVSTRIPRVQTEAVSEADFVQVTAARLDYRGEEGVAVYSDDVRVRQAEGWMESDELTLETSEDGDGVRIMRATGNVRFEFRAPDSEGVPKPVTGTGDRLVYDTAERLVRLYGDETPAAVEQSGKGAGTTTGRVLQYHLDTGALEVQSGGSGRAKIRTSEG